MYNFDDMHIEHSKMSGYGKCAWVVKAMKDSGSRSNTLTSQSEAKWKINTSSKESKK